jgi:hypothetical protein
VKLKKNTASLWSSLSVFAAMRCQREMRDEIKVIAVHHDSSAVVAR